MNATSAIGKQQSLYDHPGGKNVALSSPPLAVNVLCYCQLKTNI